MDACIAGARGVGQFAEEVSLPAARAGLGHLLGQSSEHGLQSCTRTSQGCCIQVRGDVRYGSDDEISRECQEDCKEGIVFLHSKQDGSDG